jgi:hypothetical protein
MDERHVEVAAEGLDDLGGLVLAQEAMVDEAATAESTPPESAQRTRSEPTWARMRSTCSSITAAGVQAGGAPASVCRKFLRMSWPKRVWTTSGWNWTPQKPRSGSSKAATGVDSVEATTRAPGGGSLTESRWLIQTTCSAVVPSSRPPSVATVARRSVLPYSAAPVRATVPPSSWAISCMP